MGFHRRTTPSYYGGLPAGYDYINNPALNGDPGAPAPADVKKSSGPNEGTYFVAFGEDATSSNTNRGLNAVAENTDILDDYLRRDLVVQDSTGATSAGDTSIAVSGATTPVYVGDGTEAVGEIFVLVKALSREPIYNPATGARIVVSGISGATVGTGFSTANPITINFSAAVPSGVAYVVVFGRRGVLATQATTTLSDYFPAVPTTALSVQDILRGGLNARYRNSTTASSAALDTPGAGAVITRDGAAPAVDVATTTSLFSDPIGACWKAFSSAGSVGGFISGELSGLGFVHYLSDRGSSTDTNERGPANSVGSFAAVWPHDYVGALSGTPKTQIRAGYTTGTTLNPGGVGGDVVQAGVGDFFYNGATESAVNVAYDMLEVTRASGAVEVYVITRFDTGDARRCYVRDLSGAAPVFPVNESCTLRWLSTRFWQGPSTGFKYELVNGPSSDVVYLGGLQHFMPPDNGQAAALPEPNPVFGARSSSGSALAWTAPVADASSGYSGIALGLASTKSHGQLKGDGGIQTGGYSVFGALQYKSQTHAVSVTGSQQWALDTYPLLVIDVTVDALTHTLTLPGTLSTTDGQRCAVVVRLGAGVSTFTLAWPTSPTDFVFSTSGDKTPTQAADSITRYDGIAGPAGFLMTKTSYPAGGVTGP